MQIQKITNLTPNYLIQKKQEKTTNINNNNTNNYTTIPYYNDLTFQARVDKGLVRFYEVNQSRMPKTVKRFIDKLANKETLSPLQAQTAAFAGLIGVTTVAGIKEKFPEEDLFNDLVETSETKATRGILGVYRQNKELLETCEQDILESKENFTLWLVKKIFMDGKTIDEINKDLDNEINPEFKEIYESKEPEGQYLRSSTLKALGIKMPEFEYMQSLRYTKDGYSDLVGEKISQANKEFWESLSPEERTERAKKTVLRFIKWWESIPRDEKLEMIANQVSELELLEKFNSDKEARALSRSNKTAEKQEKNNQTQPQETKIKHSSNHEKVDTGINTDSLFKAWASNNLKIFQANLTEMDKRDLATKITQRKAQKWEAMTPEEQTEYIAKMRTGAEPLRYAMIDAWNNNPDILIKLSTYSKKRHVDKPVDIFYGSTEFNKYVSEIMTDFWAEHPEYKERMGEAIRDAHYKVKSSMQEGTFEQLKLSIMQSRAERSNFVKNKVSNYREVLSADEYKTFSDETKEFIEVYTDKAENFINFLPAQYLKDFYRAVETELPREVVVSWIKDLKDEPLTEDDKINLEVVKSTNTYEVSLMNRALEASLADALYECTKSPLVYIMDQSDSKFALEMISRGAPTINLFPKDNKPEFNINVVSREFDTKKIEKTYEKFKNPTTDLFKYVESYFLVNNTNVKKIDKKHSMKVYNYLETFGKSLDIVFGQPNKYPHDIRLSFLNKIVINSPDDIYSILSGCAIFDEKGFEKEDTLYKLNSILSRKYNFVPKDAMDIYNEGLNNILRLGKKDMIEDYIRLLQSASKNDVMPLQLFKVNRNVLTDGSKICLIAAEQALADAVFQATGEEKVYSLTFEELADLIENVSSIRKPAKKIVASSSITGDVFELNFKHKINLHKMDKKVEDYLEQISEYHNEKNAHLGINKEELLIALNPYEEDKSRDQYIIARINYNFD